jgi:hypothetical protein
MNVHDWTRVEDNVFHDFHNRWITHLTDSLNSGVLPDGYFARSEQHYGLPIADLLALHEHGPNGGQGEPLSSAPRSGGLAVVDAPPKVRVRKVLHPVRRTRSKTVAVRRVNDGRIVAVIEVVSPGNKDGRVHTKGFVAKLAQTLHAGVHLMVLDLLPPNPASPDGLHMMLTNDFGIPATGDEDEDGLQPDGYPIALLSYEADLPDIGAYLEYLRVGEPLPDMPLFLTPGHYINVPLGATYETTYRPLPRVTKTALETSPTAQ